MLHVFPNFYAYVSTQFNVKIKSVRSDNAPELQFTTFFLANGILKQKKKKKHCVDRPQQNSIVERKHQHLMNVARFLHFKSNVPITYWGDLVLTATYLINRTPAPKLQHKSHYELLFHKPPSYSHLRVFGCLAYAFTLPKNRHMFSPKALITVFLGYPPTYKGYKLLDIESNTVFISRDVVFHEENFPFKDKLHEKQSFPNNVTPIDVPSLVTDPISVVKRSDTSGNS